MATVLEPNLKQDISHFKALIQDMKTAMLTTVDPQGVMHSRPMITQEVDSNGDLWFLTSLDTQKVAEIQENQKVSLSYALDEKHKFVAVTGTARIIKDDKKIELLWEPEHEKWFPDGPKDPRLAALKIEIETAEYWENNASRPYTLAQLAKAALSWGQEPRPEDTHGKLTFAG